MTEIRSLPLPVNWTAALAYLLGPFSAVVVLLLERRNDFVRFHAFQSLVTLGPLWLLVGCVEQVVFGHGARGSMPLVVIGPVVACTALLLIAMALSGKRYHFPLTGRLADRWLSAWS